MNALRTACMRGASLLRKKSTPRDEFQKWMSLINPGMLAPGNLFLFDKCIALLPSNAPIVEIGSFAGLSLNNIIYLLRRAGRTNEVFSADEWLFEGALKDGTKIPGSDVLFQDYRSNVIETFRRNVELFSGNRLPHHMALNSDSFFESWEACDHRVDFFGRETVMGGPIAMAYIDGDHSYEQSMRDFRNIDRRLEIGGFIIFDDSLDFSDWGSHKTAAEVASHPDYRLVARSPNYCVRKIS
jgi:hypothetical protein